MEARARSTLTVAYGSAPADGGRWTFSAFGHWIVGNCPRLGILIAFGRIGVLELSSDTGRGHCLDQLAKAGLLDFPKVILD